MTGPSGPLLYCGPSILDRLFWTEIVCVALDPQMVNSTLGVLLKYQDDIGRIQGSEAARILTEVQTSMIQSELSRQ